VYVASPIVQTVCRRKRTLRDSLYIAQYAV